MFRCLEKLELNTEGFEGIVRKEYRMGEGAVISEKEA